MDISFPFNKEVQPEQKYSACKNRKLFYRDMESYDLFFWEKFAENEFLVGDFCSYDYLMKDWDKINGWVLFNEEQEWIGCCFNSRKSHDFNPLGIHFLQACTFPKYRRQGYGKYLIKINHDHAVGYKKSVCINPENSASIALCSKYGFKETTFYKSWKVFICEDNYYPTELKYLDLLYVKI